MIVGVSACGETSLYCDGTSADCVALKLVGEQCAGHDDACAAADCRYLGAAAPPVTNDECSDTLPVLSDAQSNGPFTNVGATQSASPSWCLALDGGGAADVWFQYTASFSGALTIDVLGSADFDSVIELFDMTDTGGDCVTACSWACNDDAPNAVGDLQSQLRVTVRSGALYLIRVGGYDTDNTGVFFVNLNAPPAPTALSAMLCAGTAGDECHDDGAPTTVTSACTDSQRCVQRSGMSGKFCDAQCLLQSDFDNHVGTKKKREGDRRVTIMTSFFSFLVSRAQLAQFLWTRRPAIAATPASVA